MTFGVLGVICSPFINTHIDEAWGNDLLSHLSNDDDQKEIMFIERYAFIHYYSI